MGSIVAGRIVVAVLFFLVVLFFSRYGTVWYRPGWLVVDVVGAGSALFRRLGLRPTFLNASFSGQRCCPPNCFILTNAQGGMQQLTQCANSVQGPCCGWEEQVAPIGGGGVFSFLRGMVWAVRSNFTGEAYYGFRKVLYDT